MKVDFKNIKIIVTISGPQGSGKGVIKDVLERILKVIGVKFTMRVRNNYE